MTELDDREKMVLEEIQRRFGPELWHAYNEDKTTQEIMLNPDGRIWVENHHMGLHDFGMSMEPHDADAIIRAVAGVNDVTVNYDNPEVAATIPGKRARFQALIPPVVRRPTFCIRIPSLFFIPLESYLRDRTLTQHQAGIIMWAVNQRKNILVVGSTGSGKTTLANAIIDKMTPLGHRVVTIEDAYELRCMVPNTVNMLVARQSQFDYRRAVFTAMRLRPDRIIVGELRDGLAAHELLKAWNTGHNGGLATIHADSAQAAIPRLESLLAEKEGHTSRDLIAQAIDVIIFISRLDADHPSRLKRCVENVAVLFNELDEHNNFRFQHHKHDLLHVA